MTNTKTERLGVSSQTTLTHTSAEKAKGEIIMKNTIKMNREAELQAKEAAKKAAEKAAALKDVKPLNIVETLKQLEESKTDAKVVCDKDGNPIAVCGGKYLCESYKGEIIGADSPEKLEAIKARIDKGIHGDGLLHKMVTVNGRSLPCVGKTEDEIEKDVRSLEIYSAQHPVEPRRDLTVASMLLEAGFKSEDIEQVSAGSKDYLLVYSDSNGSKNYVMDLDGSTVKDAAGKEVTLSDIEDELSRKTVKILLLERLEKAVASKKAAPVTKPTAPKTPKTRKTRGVMVCRVIINRSLGHTADPETLETVIRNVLKAQSWTVKSYNGNPECPAIERVVDDIAVVCSEDLRRTVVYPTASYIVEQIASESPIEAESLEELKGKIEEIVFDALREEPYFGMTPCDGRKLAKVMAKHIFNNSTVAYC